MCRNTGISLEGHCSGAKQSLCSTRVLGPRCADEKHPFYSPQVHATGTDIPHVPNACAVLTLGKDMTFRDFAQGAFRMRGFGLGQTICLFLIPEIRKLMSRHCGMAGTFLCSARANPRCWWGFMWVSCVFDSFAAAAYLGNRVIVCCLLLCSVQLSGTR